MIILSGSACRYILALLLLVNYLPLSAQKEPSIWLFGDHNGIDFRSGSPFAISNPNVSYHGAEVRGVATVTDANGDLLFYAENETVYTRQHDTMQNGAKMNSVWAASQTGLTVRAIHDTSLYYLFTINMYEINGQSYSKPDLWYSVIDMKGNNGSGAVTTKNVLLFDKPTTQICAIRHCNERDIWIVTHELESDAYYAFLVGPGGVNTTPVISRSGRHIIATGSSGFSNQYGYMKGSPDGKKIAASWSTLGVDLSDFDNATGVVYNSINLNLMNNFWAHAQGVEFSANSGVLYANYHVYSASFLYQYNVNAGSDAAIRASKTKLEEIDFFGYFAGMQRGPDNKIYLATYGQPSVSVIHNPDVVGVGCNYVFQGLVLNYRSSHTFPAYMETKYFPETPSFTFSAACPAERVSFDYDKPDNVISVKWDFDDPSSGSANTSTELSPIHEFTATGTYRVKLIRFLVCNTDTLEEEISVTKLHVDLGNDTTLCDNETLLLVAGDPNVGYTWQDRTTNNSFQVNAPGLYIVTASSEACAVKDSVQVNYNKKPVFSLGEDKVFCNGDVIILGGKLENIYAYEWEDGSTSPLRTVKQPGTYRVTGSNSCGTFSDEVIVRPGRCVLGIPNAFSPNGDGKNEVFSISKTVPLGSFVMQVYNRWGQKIFESRDQSKGWDGTFAGKRSEVGHYAYIIQYSAEDGTPVMLNGMVLLVR